MIIYRIANSLVGNAVGARLLVALSAIFTMQAAQAQEIPASLKTVEVSEKVSAALEKLPSETDRIILRNLITNMVVIPGGSFRMGDTQGVGENDEGPVRVVDVAPFALSRYEVTFEQYDLFARQTGRRAPKDRWGRERRPVIDVTWKSAHRFIRWLRETTSMPFRLPSEAEWEYAARAGSDDIYSFGSDPSVICNFANIADKSSTVGWRYEMCEDGFTTTAPVGSFQPNAFGLYDMHGNVWEWMEDCWFRNYKRAPNESAARTRSSCEKRVQRGGGWAYGPEESRVSYRSHGEESDKSVTLGFRLALDLVDGDE